MIIDWIQGCLQQYAGVPEKVSHNLAVLLFILSLFAVAFVVNFIAQTYLTMVLRSMVRRTKTLWGEQALKSGIIKRLAHFIPASLIYFFTALEGETLKGLNSSLIYLIHIFVFVYMIWIFIWSFHALCQVIEAVYHTRAASMKHFKAVPIKPYLQVARLIIYFISFILLISVLMDKSPWALLTGLGAVAALLMLVFKDTILGLVASIQMATYDIVRVGDWIVVPAYNANGDVMEMSLNTVKVQNFDKTVTTIPTGALLTTGVTNWRGMVESGGRRIKRSIDIDLNSIKFADQDLIHSLSQVQYLKEHIQTKHQEIAMYNEKLGVQNQTSINGRSLTNVGLFRAYCNVYLAEHPDIHQGLTLLIRQLQPTATGLPIELYIFTNDTDWNRYEDIQSDVFDHLLAVLPYFHLKVYQNISGSISAGAKQCG